MNHCIDCKAELSEDAGFCHKCGHPVGGQASRRPAGAASFRRLDPELIAKSRAEHAAIRADILLKARVKAGKALTFFLTSCFVLAMAWAQDSGSNGFYYFLGLAFSLVLTSMFMGRDRWLTQAEYYSISGALDANGEHRCIFCGNKGIYWQGEYAGNAKFAQCSKCKEPLFFN
jgi:hypothetical protein